MVLWNGVNMELKILGVEKYYLDLYAYIVCYEKKIYL